MKRWLFCLLLALCAAAASAATATWPDARITMQAQERPLREFLSDLFGAVGMRVSISEGVTGRVSGRFNDKPEAIFAQLVQANNLLPYHDGAVMHVASANEVGGKSIAVAPDEGRAVIAAVARLGVDGRHQSAQLVGDGRLLKVRGSPPFIRDVEDLVESRRRVPAREAPAPGAPGAVAINSPPPAALPAPAGPTIVRSFALKHASAADVVLYQNGQPITVPGVATMLGAMLGDGSLPQPYAAGNRNLGNGNVEKLRGRGLRRYGVNAAADELEPNRAASPQRADAPTGPRGATRIVADRTLNAVVVRDTAEAMPQIEQMIGELDKSPQLVEIQVTIIDIDQSKLQDLGFDWRFNDGRTSLQLGGGGAQPPATAGGLIFNTVLGDVGRFFARINALASEGAARVSSRPQVLTINNMEAVLTSDQSFYVRVAGNQDVDLFNVTAGTALRVTPFVVGEAGAPQIRLTVTIEDGSISNDAAVDGIPVVDRSSLNTQAVIFSGENLLLGGLVRERDIKNTDKVPLLGDIPAVGKLFQRTTTTQSRKERLYLITPRLVSDQRATRPASPAEPAGRPSAAPDPAGTVPQGPFPNVKPSAVPSAVTRNGHG
jgi:type III secretion protein C